PGPGKLADEKSKLPDSPSATTSPGAPQTKVVIPLPGRPQHVALTNDKNAPDNKHIQELQQQADSLEQILKNQAHPENLAIVKNSRTLILSRAADAAQVVLLADAEDEFQILDLDSSWVHVQISGLSLGWL